MSSPSLMLLFGIAAAAVPQQTVRLGLGDCVPSRDLVHDLVAIEIGFENLVDRTDAAIEVRVECRADQVIIALLPGAIRAPDERARSNDLVALDGRTASNGTASHGRTASNGRAASNGRTAKDGLTSSSPSDGREAASANPALRGVPARVIALSEVEKRDGARLVALNIVELLNTSAASQAAASQAAVSQPAVALEPTLAPAQKKAAPAVVVRSDDPPRGPHRLRVAAAPALRYQAKPGRFAYGARASFGIDAPRFAAFPWTLQLGGGVEQSESSVALGTIKTRAAAISFGAGERIDVSDEVAIFGLIGASGGYANLDVSTGDAKIIARGGSGWWLGPMLAARVRYGARAGISLGVEAGLITREVYGELPGGEKFGQRGAWLGLELALDWSL